MGGGRGRRVHRLGREVRVGGEQANMNGLLALETKVMSRPMARSYSEALKQLRGAVLMPVTPVATEGHAEACSLGYRGPVGGHVDVQRPCHCWRHTDLDGRCCHV